MKLSKLKGLSDMSIRRVYNDDKTVTYGMVGTVEDMFHIGVLEFCSAQAWEWAFVTPDGEAFFDEDRDELCKSVVNSLKEGE